jgi:sugar lactone lactonase YvrE
VLARIDAKGTQLIGLAAGAGHVWLLDSSTARILGIDPRRNRVDVELTIPGEEGGAFAATPDAIWYAGTSKRLYRIDGHGEITAKVPLPSSGSPLWPTIIGDEVYVTDPGASRIYVVDMITLEITGKIPLAGEIFSSSVGFGSLWVAAASGPVFRVDPKTGQIRATIVVPMADNVVACDRRVWIRVNDQEIRGIDPDTNKTTKIYKLPAAEIPGGGFLCRPDALWITNWSDASVWKIPTRT